MVLASPFTGAIRCTAPTLEELRDDRPRGVRGNRRFALNLDASVTRDCSCFQYPRHCGGSLGHQGARWHTKQLRAVHQLGRSSLLLQLRRAARRVFEGLEPAPEKGLRHSDIGSVGPQERERPDQASPAAFLKLENESPLDEISLTRGHLLA